MNSEVDVLYQEFYGLTDRPFQLGSGEAGFFAGRPQRRVLAEILDAIALPGALIAIEGMPGVGKSTMLAFLEARLLRAGMRVIPARGGTARSPLASLADRLGTGGSIDDGFMAALARAPVHGRDSLLLLVDEAQDLGAVAAGELLDLLSASSGRARMRLILMLRAGAPQASGNLASLLDRVGPAQVLEAFDPVDTNGYLDHRLRRAGWQGDALLGPDGVAALHRETGGIARAVNRLGSLLLVHGAIAHRRRLEESDVRTVARIAATDAATPSRAGAMPISPAVSSPAEVTPSEGSAELTRLRQRLDHAYDALSGERQRHDETRAEADRLRRALHRMQLRRVLTEREASHRLADLAVRLAAPRLRGVGHEGAPEHG